MPAPRRSTPDCWRTDQEGALILPRLQETWSNRWISLCVVVAWHAAQHVTLPLIFDVRFIAWRFFMFLPLAFLVAAAIQRRRSVLPYLMASLGIMGAMMGGVATTARLLGILGFFRIMAASRKYTAQSP